MAYFLTRLNVGDYGTWKPQFDADVPGARKAATGHRIFLNVDNPGEVYILVEFASADEAKAGRQLLLDSGVLDRFTDKSGPVIVEDVETVVR